MQTIMTSPTKKWFEEEYWERVRIQVSNIEVTENTYQ